MTKFADLEFKPHDVLSGTVRARLTFENGFGASVVQGPYTYGGNAGLYELAVLDAAENVVYSTPVTDDVLGHLSEDQVTDALAQIAALPPLKVEAA